jgi:hypothetical protein
LGGPCVARVYPGHWQPDGDLEGDVVLLAILVPRRSLTKRMCHYATMHAGAKSPNSQRRRCRIDPDRAAARICSSSPSAAPLPIHTMPQPRLRPRPRRELTEQQQSTRCRMRVCLATIGGTSRGRLAVRTRCGIGRIRVAPGPAVVMSSIEHGRCMT